MADRKVDTLTPMTVIEAKRMYQKTLSLWVIDYLTSRSLIKRQRVIRAIATKETLATAQE